AADLAISSLLEPHRAARLIDFHARDSQYPGFQEVVDALITRTWKAVAPKDGYGAEIQRAVQNLAVSEMTDLAANSQPSPEVRSVAAEGLRGLRAFLKPPEARRLPSGHVVGAVEEIDRFLNRPDETHKQTKPLETPPGDPIGGKGRSDER